MAAPGGPDGLPLPPWAATGRELPLTSESSVEAHAWEDAAFDDPQRFTADLEAIGLCGHEVDHGLEILRSAQEEASGAVEAFWDAQSYRYIDAPDAIVSEAGRVYHATRASALTRLKDWLAGRRVVVDGTDLVQVRLPLFVLAAPAVPGCVATYTSKTDQSHKLGWTITLFGTGTSGDATVTSSVTSTFTADAGTAVLVFLPVTVAVEQVRVIGRDGKTLGSGQRVDVSPAIRQHPIPGGLTLDTAALPPAGPHVADYPLAGYAAGSPADYLYEYSEEQTTKLQIGVKAGGAEVAVTSEVGLTSAVTLDFKLVGGRDYELCRLEDGQGYGRVWA